MYSLIIADDEAIECRGMEMRIQNHFTDIELLPSVYNGIDFLKSVAGTDRAGSVENSEVKVFFNENHYQHSI